MIKRFAAAALAATAMVMSLGGGASAQASPTLEYLGGPETNAILAGAAPTITVKAYSPTGVKNIHIEIIADSPSSVLLGPGGVPSGCSLDGARKKLVCDWNYGYTGLPNDHTESVPWNTGALTSHNGTYHVVVDMASHVYQGNDPPAIQKTNLRVNNGTVAPAGLSAQFVSSDDWFDGADTIKVSWNASNNAPDHQNFKLLRSDNGGASYGQPITLTATSYTDSSLSPGGSYRYQVIAQRYSPVSGSIASGSVSTNVITTPAVKPPPPPPDPDPSPSGSPTSKTKTAAGSPPGLTLQSDDKRGAPPSVPLQSIKPPVINTGPARAGGFSKLLPFSGSIPKVLAEGTPGSSGTSVTSSLAAPGKLVGEQLRVNPVRFLAAGALLLVLAGHLARVARGLLLVQPPELSAI